MYCQKCGTNLLDSAKFCNECGSQASSSPEVTKAQVGANRFVSFIKTALLAALVLVAIGLVAMLIGNYTSRSANSSPFLDRQSSLTVSLRPKEIDTVNDSFALPPGYLKSYPLSVGKHGKVSGRFQAQGGIDDAIRVVITDANGYTNMSHGNGYRCWYDSREVTVDNISADLSPGEYLLVYSNRGSLTNRTITTKVHLSDCCY